MSRIARVCSHCPEKFSTNACDLIRTHAFDLGVKVVSQLAGGGEPRQFIVWERTPKRKRQPSCKTVLVNPGERFAGG